MPKIVWESQENRTAAEQQAAEWRIAKKYLAGRAPGTQLNPKHGQHKISFKDPKTNEEVYLTHRYLLGNKGEIFVKSNGYLLGKTPRNLVTFGQTQDGQVWAIKESCEIGKDLKESEIACDLDAAKKMFKSNSKCYQVYRFLGLPLDQYLRQNRLTEEERLDLAIKVSQAVHHLHIGTQSRSHTCYAHLDLKPSNICIDHEGQVHLIDYGFSKSLAGRLTHRKGTSSYLSVDYASASKEALDIFALLRTLYLPKKFKTYTQKAKKSRDHHEYILNDDIISKNGLLYALLDTEDGKIKHTRKRRYLGRYFAHPMMQNRRAKRDDYKPSAVRVTQRCVP
ncbi:kinase [Piscirickettsia salmonis]|uniref:ATPase n=2 Tax=Piscirickettsia salmonis TaxID=1238 RepID=A0A9Q6PTF3_PISSA|nr:protein kinase [Piscirickettsia salmonis]ALA26009.1 tyrosine kinase family protein [Piscirickettsia salmonis]APS43469.1 kinase [Piscirickettsia salmonis]APS46821.1 kinase [Piscirickettsia salmonis]APS50795.1 kinase [Piscirickettsia salmonis]APS53999.1 kinase [Piscirickettsia salmonis]